MPRMTRAERSAHSRKVWEEAVAELQGTFLDAAPRLGASKEERREARRRRQAARARRDRTWRAEITAAIAAGSSVPTPRRPGPARRQARAIEASIDAAWQESRPPTRAQRRVLNQQAWAQLHLARLDQTAAARTARRGARRQAHSQAWLAAQAARIQSALPTAPADPRRDRS